MLSLQGCLNWFSSCRESSDRQDYAAEQFSADFARLFGAIFILSGQYDLAIYRGLYGHKLGVNIETDMRQELFRHLQTQSFEYYDNQKLDV